MAKQEYNRKTKQGWIDDQLCRAVGYLEGPKGRYGDCFGLYLEENNIEVFLTRKQLRELKLLIDEFVQEERV